MVFYHLLSTEFTCTHPHEYKVNKIDHLNVFTIDMNRATKNIVLLGQLYRKFMFKTSRGLEIIARWGPHPTSMVLQSEGSPKSEMLSLARTSK